MPFGRYDKSLDPARWAMSKGAEKAPELLEPFRVI
jgi:hypothetical protein